MEYLARIIPEEHAAARQILNMRRPFGRSAEIVLRSTHRHILSRFFDEECKQYALRKLDDVEFFLLGRKAYETFPFGPPLKETHTSTGSMG
jgi:hypothetical protein